ncbi:tRNA (adenosine(37)-N6)-dimethylallyltransferase MiaA [Campylobacter geochelonis]|uniref:tRNA dimethylallyltransferase n=1 Tax=Campylobacter geochelonis TaxID=1780362 RepID=A0A128ECG6_9BACT|nr:tRNA (adenosine(37)-N6)-dimethylallyltransferase MiaA [Campylobacter geochelonis]QKF70553.1 tRNA(i6A37) synthase [Campylobacter geochelonis]CZE46052.1 tRNA delta(2)-isopentenylpyrophosphate transferase [Campylobacter geochelonis]CZE50405.1 tRNA delta(2)-isopentenylpyrophosphate transferase [Campylobacter geochelonis]
MFFEFAIVGTTASGKSDLALNLATKFNCIILSLDSLCLYKQIDIASAKPSADELSLAKHFGIDLVYPDEHFSVGDFIKEYKKAKEFALNLDVPLIITGGSGFYLKTMLSGLSPKIDDVKTTLSNVEIYELISKFDPEFKAKFSQNDSYRLLKWYSIYKTTGRIPSLFLRENTTAPTISNLAIFEIESPKEFLNERIKTRTKKMLEAGLVDEAEYLFKKYGKEQKALNCIGLKECKEFLDEKISKDELENLISTHTIQLAKRQRTFNKSQFKDKILLNLDELEAHLTKLLNSKTR